MDAILLSLTRKVSLFSLRGDRLFKLEFYNVIFQTSSVRDFLVLGAFMILK